MRNPFACDLTMFYRRAGLKPANGLASRPALVLTPPAIRREVAVKNIEVLVVVAFALNPTRFADHVEVFQIEGKPDTFRYRVRSTGRVYEMASVDVFRLAVTFLLKTGRQAEVFA